VVSALAATGLRVEFLHEFAGLHLPAFSIHEAGNDGLWHIEGDPIPTSFSIKAAKPANVGRSLMLKTAASANLFGIEYPIVCAEWAESRSRISPPRLSEAGARQQLLLQDLGEGNPRSDCRGEKN